jgi:hypothetical protein
MQTFLFVGSSNVPKFTPPWAGMEGSLVVEYGTNMSTRAVHA